MNSRRPGMPETDMDDHCYPSDCEITQGLLQKAMAGQRKEERGYVWRACFDKASQVRLLLLDVDGVLTDGSITYTGEGTELKAFNTRDGFGLYLVRQAEVKLGLITARQSEAVARRARDLDMSYVYQGRRDKIAAYEEILALENITDRQVAYVGDDWMDVPLLSRVGFAATVADAVPEVKRLVHYTTTRTGGRGAVREICDLIIDAKGLTEELFRRYLPGR